MMPIPSKFIYLAALIGFGLGTLGCNGSGGGGFASGGRGSTKKKAAPTSTSTPGGTSASGSQDAGAVATNPGSSGQVDAGTPSAGNQGFDVLADQAVLENIAATSTEEYLAAALANASDIPFEMGGYYFTNVKEVITRYEFELMALADKYPTLGDFMQSRGADPLAHAEVDDIGKGLALAESFVNDGNLDDIGSDLPSDDGEGETGSADGGSEFYLTGTLDKEAAREAKLMALTFVAIPLHKAAAGSGLYLGNYDNPSGNVIRDCGVSAKKGDGFMSIDWKLDEGCVCGHYPHGCKMAEQAGQPKYCTGAPTPNDVGYDKDCPGTPPPQ